MIKICEYKVKQTQTNKRGFTHSDEYLATDKEVERLRLKHKITGDVGTTSWGMKLEISKLDNPEEVEYIPFYI